MKLKDGDKVMHIGRISGVVPYGTMGTVYKSMGYHGRKSIHPDSHKMTVFVEWQDGYLCSEYVRFLKKQAHIWD